MRFNFTRIAVLAFALTALFSCNRNEFSCDADVEEWTKTHLEEYVTAERKSIVSLPLDRQMAIYNGLTPEGRARLWKEKMAILINDNSYSNDEKVLFSLISKIVTPRLFDDNSDQYALVAEYEELSRRVFNGNANRFASALCTWMTEEEYQKALIAQSPVLTKIDGGGFDSNTYCTCRHSVGCSGGGTCNRNLSCKEKEKGCGFMGYYSCDGVCE